MRSWFWRMVGVFLAGNSLWLAVRRVHDWIPQVPPLGWTTAVLLVLAVWFMVVAFGLAARDVLRED